MPRIGFDGRALASPAAGVRRYAAELFGALAGLDADLSIVSVGAPEGTPLPAGVHRAPGSLSLPTNAGWMLTGLPRAAHAARLDLFHAPAYTVPFGPPRPLVVTIHDVSYERHPEWYPYRRDPLRRALYRRSARAADRVITDSSFSRDEIMAAYGLPAAQVDVVPLAAGPLFRPGPPLPLPHGIPARYLLHVGDLHARRNIPMIVRALRHARAQGRLRDVALVLAGVRHEEIAGLPVDGTTAGGGPLLIFAGRTADPTLLALYRSAAALVYPSRYEGFGLPLLEAMGCGLPVVASNTSCIPEVTGGAAVLVDPDDVDGWSAALERVVEDERHAESLRQAGIQRASCFSWARTAGATAVIYRRLLGIA